MSRKKPRQAGGLPREGARPGARRRPEALGRLDVDLAEAVAIVVPRVLAPAVADGLVSMAPSFRAGVDVVLAGTRQSTLGDLPGGRGRRPRRYAPEHPWRPWPR